MRKIKDEKRANEEIEKYYKAIEEKYSSYVKKMPTLIQTNGLGNMLAFCRSKFGAEDAEKSGEKRAYKLLYEHINGWFKERSGESRDIIEWILSEDTSSLDVFRVTKEILAVLNWMKRFAEAELKGEESEE